MWGLRRASIHATNRGLRLETTQICSMKSEIARCYSGKFTAGVIKPQENKLDGLGYLTRFYRTPSSSSKSYTAVCSFSSQAIGGRSSGEHDDDSEDAFPVQGAASGDEIDVESVFESDISEDESVAEDIPKELESTEDGEKGSPLFKPIPAMTKAILAAPALSVGKVLDKWVQDGNEVTRTNVALSLLHFRRRRMYVKALQLSEWLESTKHLEFLENNYVSHVDLIAKTRGIYKAEEYLENIPESFRGEIAYRTILANCVSVLNVKKSEEVFNKMKGLFPLTCFSCDQLLFLYKRIDKKKIADVLLLMEKENIKPSVFTYQILIDLKGQYKDIGGMEQIVETMKSEGVEPNLKIQITLARHYAAAGLKDKAEAVLKDVEGSDSIKVRQISPFLLPIYASLGREDEVGRIWKLCECNPRFRESLAAIRAWGQLNRIEDAEAAFDKVGQKVKMSTSRHYAALLNVYANHKMLNKGKDLVRRMAESGGIAGPLVWDGVVKLYARAGEVEKADSILEKAINKKEGRPLFGSFTTILDQYAKRGDIHNAEKTFLKMREARYVLKGRPYKLLLQSYVNAKAPAYGFRERLKGDSIVPNKDLVDLLVKTESLIKSPVSELLE